MQIHCSSVIQSTLSTASALPLFPLIPSRLAALKQINSRKKAILDFCNKMNSLFQVSVVQSFAFIHSFKFQN